MATKVAMRILAAMEASAANKTQKDMEKVASGFGFDIWEGKNHTTYQHSKYHELMGQWPRHGEVDAVYVKQLIKTIKRLEEREGKKGDG